MLNNWTQILYLLPAILISLTVHEFSHAFVSYKFGDPTAKNLGRLSLNPIKHIDIIGTIMLILFRFGWARPVPINPIYYKRKKMGTIIVSLAGPLANVILAFISLIAINLMYFYIGNQVIFATIYLSILYTFTYTLYVINVGLAAFNILPIPPLDGSRILSGILPAKDYFKLMEYENYFAIGFLVIMLIFPSFLTRIVSPLIWGLEHVLNFVVGKIFTLFI